MTEADLDLCCLLTELLDTIKSITESKCLDETLHILRMLKDTFLLGVDKFIFTSLRAKSADAILCYFSYFSKKMGLTSCELSP